MIEFITTNLNTIIASIFIISFIIIDYYFRKKINKLRDNINAKLSEQEEDFEDLDTIEQELYIDYYKEKNILNLIRFSILFWWIIFIILFKVPWVFSFLAIAVWAIIITFKELLLSFFAFFYISTHYKIWDNILLWDVHNIMRWEIVYINILNIWLIWKNEYWEHNWQFYTIPNFKIILDNVKKEELSINKYKKEEIDIYFNNEIFKINFDDFLSELKTFLDSILVKRNIHNVWNYKTYIWYRYKLRYRYEKEYTIVKLNFIEKAKTWLEIQEKIAKFIEAQKIKETVI